MSAERCAECGRRRDTRTCQKYGGGNYRRAGRYYWSSICEECAHEILRYVEECLAGGRNPGTQSRGWSHSSLRHRWPL